MATVTFVKDPNAVLDYGFDWTQWLENGDTISTVVWTVPTGITKTNESKTNTTSTIWLSGGTDKHNYLIGCRVTTLSGRIDDRSMEILVRNK